MNEGWNNYHKRFHTDGKLKRRSFNDWVEDMKKLSGKTDVSQADLSDDQVQEAFAESYAAAECVEGRWREEHPNDPTET